MKIEITQQHIDTGEVRNAFSCAIAVALKQEFAYEVSVTGLIRIGKDNYLATPEVVRWFNDFDRGRKVNPITIELVADPFGRTFRPKVRPKGHKPIGKTYRSKSRPKGHKPTERTYRQPILICGTARVAGSQG